MDGEPTIYKVLVTLSSGRAQIHNVAACSPEGAEGASKNFLESTHDLLGIKDEATYECLEALGPVLVRSSGPASLMRGEGS